MKNYFMEMIQDSGQIPENGENYIEKVSRVGGMDNDPKFHFYVEFNGEKVEFEDYTSKKAGLRRAWKELHEKY